MIKVNNDEKVRKYGKIYLYLKMIATFCFQILRQFFPIPLTMINIKKKADF